VTAPEPRDAAATYASYLALDEILGAQRPRSDEHDELLFIVIHQVYELWFKQLLHELSMLQQRLETGHGALALHTLRRTLTIFKTIVAQVDVLETMTPRQFTAFRDRLDAASGFQSAQFRVLECTLGRRDRGVLTAYREGTPEHAAITAAMARRSVYDSFLRFLAGQGHAVPADVLEREVSAPAPPSPAVQDLLIHVYGEDELAEQVCERLVDLDEGLQEWRYRHVKMVQRTIGDRRGTGGSAGARYLASTLDQPLFPDLWAVRSRL